MQTEIGIIVLKNIVLLKKYLCLCYKALFKNRIWKKSNFMTLRVWKKQQHLLKIREERQKFLDKNLGFFTNVDCFLDYSKIRTGYMKLFLFVNG